MKFVSEISRLLFGRGVYSAGMGIIQTPNLRAALQSIQRDVDDRSRKARVGIARESVNALRSSRSLVNVDTGKMKRGFRASVARGNNRIDIVNSVRSARGFRYPIVVERRYRGVERTLRARSSEIVRRVNVTT